MYRQVKPNAMCGGELVVQFAMIRAYDVVCMFVTFKDIHLKRI